VAERALGSATGRSPPVKNRENTGERLCSATESPLFIEACPPKSPLIHPSTLILLEAGAPSGLECRSGHYMTEKMAMQAIFRPIRSCLSL
jgi:hypothetical protein